VATSPRHALLPAKSMNLFVLPQTYWMTGATLCFLIDLFQNRQGRLFGGPFW
jgi:hypothetical protein